MGAAQSNYAAITHALEGAKLGNGATGLSEVKSVAEIGPTGIGVTWNAGAAKAFEASGFASRAGGPDSEWEVESGCPTLVFQRVGLGVRFPPLIPERRQLQSAPPHLLCRTTNCSTASLSDAAPIRALPGCCACSPAFLVSSRSCTR